MSELAAWCAVCDLESEVRPVMVLPGTDAGIRGSYDVVDCQACGFRFVHPTPTADELSHHYASAFARSYGNYVQARELKKQHFRYQLERVSDRLPGPGACMLDVGCAAGFLLEVAQGRGWDVHGVELEAKARDAASPKVRERIHIGRLDEVDFGRDQRPFDLITAFDLIEHVGDPRAMLAQCRDLLAASGRLLVQIPCIDSLGARLMGRRWFHYSAPSHLSYFSGQTFSRLAEPLGFELLESTWTRKLLSVGYFRDQVTMMLWGRRLAALGLGPLDDLRLALPMGERLMVLRPR